MRHAFPLQSTFEVFELWLVAAENDRVGARGQVAGAALAGCVTHLRCE